MARILTAPAAAPAPVDTARAWGVAIHESGHALVAAAKGTPFVVRHYGDCGSCGSADAERPTVADVLAAVGVVTLDVPADAREFVRHEPAVARALRWMVAGALAGAAAEVAAGLAPRPDGGTLFAASPAAVWDWVPDLTMARGALLALVEPRSLAHARATMLTAFRRVEGFLATHEPQLRAVATALLERRELNHVEVREITGALGYEPPDPAAL